MPLVRTPSPAPLYTPSFVHGKLTNTSGPQVFLSWDSPRYLIAFATHMGCYVLLVIVLIFLRWYLRHENMKKDRVQAEFLAAGTGVVPDAGLAHAFDDLTDKENLNFRYVY